MSSEGSVIKAKIIELQKEILNLKGKLQDQQINSENALQTIFVEQIEWFDHLQLMLDDLKLCAPDNETATNKSLEKLRNKMERSFLKNSISKILPTDLNSYQDGLKVVETRAHPSMEYGSVLEIIRQGYQWKGKVLRKTEIVTVKNELG